MNNILNRIRTLSITLALSLYGHGGDLKAFDSGNNSELISTLRVYTDMNSPKVYVYKYTFSDDISVGTLIQWNAHGEVTNDLGYNVCVSFKTVILNEDETQVIAELSEFRGSNVSKDMHHSTFFDGGSYMTTFDIPAGSKIAVQLMAGSTRAKASSTIKVEKDYGRLNGFLLKL